MQATPTRSGTMSDAEWLRGLSVGDTVAVRDGYGHARYTLETVQRVTATQVILPHEKRFRRDTGRVVGGGGYDVRSLCIPTAEIRATVRQRFLTDRLAGTAWHTLPLETLEAVYAAAGGK